MLARILQPSPPLCAFLEPLCGSLSKPRKVHLQELCDGILVCETDHTLAAMQRLFVETTDQSNWADFLRISPWSQDAVRAELLKSQIVWALEQGQKNNPVKEIYLNFDDSLGVKGEKTWRLEIADWFHDHAHSTPQRPRYQKAFCYVACTMCVGDVTVTLDVRLYLRQRTLRVLNRKRAPQERIRYQSKNTIVRARLARLAPYLPPDWTVIVQFDSWYASQKLLKFVRRQQWDFTCGVKCNRKLNGVRLAYQHLQEKHKWYTRVRVTNAKQEECCYYVWSLTGRLEQLPFEPGVLISKQHPGQQAPAYFAHTRACKPQVILQGYTGRWSCEVVNFYARTQLGLEDFRCWSIEATDKYVVAVHLAWAYAEGRYSEEKSAQIKCYGNLIRRHRDEHAVRLVQTVLCLARAGLTDDEVVQRLRYQEHPAN
jgi:hypothetical protein